MGGSRPYPARDVTIEALPGSTLPDELRQRGYDVRATCEEGERILSNAITERFQQKADGSLGPLTEGSTNPVALIAHHAGIVRVRRYAFPVR